MNKTCLRLWYVSVAGFVICIFPFVTFMFSAKLKHMLLSFAFIAAAAVFYFIMTRKITHPKYGYTAYHAAEFYKRCIAAELNTVNDCRHNAEKFKDIGKNYKHTEKFDYRELLAIFEDGKKISE